MRTSTPNRRPTEMDQLRIGLRCFYSTCLDIVIAALKRYRAMRVIAGKYRSRPLRSLRGMDIRPTSDRLRETLFNVLTAGNPAALAGSVWLDLFAGTGAVGIEALSRGAKEVHFVENSACCCRRDSRKICRASGSRKDSRSCRKSCRGRSGAWSGSGWRPMLFSSIRHIA